MLFVGQAFIYNGITFDLGTLFTTFYGVASGFVPVFVIIYAVGNLAGPMALGRLFDTVGRKPMIIATYAISAGLGLALAYLFWQNTLTRWPLEALIVASFFFASAGASAAYLTVSEIFPMETRALAIAFFYAIGTGAGGIAGPLLFGRFIESESRLQVAIAFAIGSVVMALGALAEALWGVKAEQQQLEDIAKPLTAADAEQDGAAGQGEETPESELHPEHRDALRLRAAAVGERARAAEHRALAHELAGEGTAAGEDVSDRVAVEAQLADIADLRARAIDERASAADERAAAAERAAQDERAGEDEHPGEDQRAARNEGAAVTEGGEGSRAAAQAAAEARAAAAEERAHAFDRRADALAAERADEAERYEQLAAAAGERAQAREQRALAEQARSEAIGAEEGKSAAEEGARAHEAWARQHAHLAAAHERRAAGDASGAQDQERRARHAEELGLAAGERAAAAREVEASEALRQQEERVGDLARRRESDRRRREHEARMRQRLERRQRRERTGARRFRPGPGSGHSFYSPGMLGTFASSRDIEREQEDLDREVDAIGRALEESGPLGRSELARLVGARFWGPGRFSAALRQALDDGRARAISRRSYAAPEHSHAAHGDEHD
jgi:Major Facilitator Superfamily